VEQLPKYIREDTAVFIVPDLLRSVDPYRNRETHRVGARAFGGHLQETAIREPVGNRRRQALDRVNLFAGKGQR
jgi:hypothetical protein